jgi:hypothetical protein
VNSQVDVLLSEWIASDLRDYRCSWLLFDLEPPPDSWRWSDALFAGSRGVDIRASLVNSLGAAGIVVVDFDPLYGASTKDVPYGVRDCSVESFVQSDWPDSAYRSGVALVQARQPNTETALAAGRRILEGVRSAAAKVSIDEADLLSCRAAFVMNEMHGDFPDMLAVVHQRFADEWLRTCLETAKDLGDFCGTVPEAAIAQVISKQIAR